MALPFLKVDYMISILMPIYNGIEFIEESVTSVINQTYENWELIIGVNGNLPESDIYILAKKYELRSNKIRTFDLHQIKGKSNTLNEIIKYCKYNYIAILDINDIWHKKKLEIQVPFLKRYDVIGSKCIYFGDTPGIVPSIPLEDISNYNFSIANPIINSSVIMQKELCYWNPIWDSIEDYDMWLRLRAQNKKFYNSVYILFRHRIHNSSAFNAKENNNKVTDLLLNHGYIK